MKHVRTKKCVKCGAIWQITWFDNEAWLEFITCPTKCRVYTGA